MREERAPGYKHNHSMSNATLPKYNQLAANNSLDDGVAMVIDESLKNSVRVRKN